MKGKTASRRRAKSATSATAAVSGAEPYQPKMSAAEMRSAVEAHLGQRVKLANYRSTVTPLTANERDLMIAQAIRNVGPGLRPSAAQTRITR
jgi:hypothetical protein